jgi:hypothetical protein
MNTNEQNKAQHTLIAFLQFGTGIGPFLTLSAPLKVSELSWQKLGLQQTASGYGRRLATQYMVKHQNRWMRVYVCQYSNAGTAYIGPSSKWLATVSIN